MLKLKAPFVKIYKKKKDLGKKKKPKKRSHQQKKVALPHQHQHQHQHDKQGIHFHATPVDNSSPGKLIRPNKKRKREEIGGNRLNGSSHGGGDIIIGGHEDGIKGAYNVHKARIGERDQPQAINVAKSRFVNVLGSVNGMMTTTTTTTMKRKRTTELNDAVAAAKSNAAMEKVEVRLKKRKEKEIVEHIVDEGVKALYIAVDCEMVGIGPNGKTSALAQVCLVDWNGNVVYKEYVRPQGRVTDFRTQFSGIRPENVRNARSFKEIQSEVAEILKGKILVGHALSNDLKALVLGHPKTQIRDTARYRPFMRIQGREGGKLKARSLKKLAKEFLDKDIQGGEHDPEEDAASAMMLYRLKRAEWEKGLLDLKSKKSYFKQA